MIQLWRVASTGMANSVFPGTPGKTNSGTAKGNEKPIVAVPSGRGKLAFPTA